MLFGFLVLTVTGIVFVSANLRNVQRRKRILATPTSPIAQAKGGAVVEIKGRIVPSEQGLVEAPFSGRAGVWCRVVVQEARQSGRTRSWHTLLDQVDGRPFLVDDGSGQLARVLPAGATVILERDDVASSGTFHDASPRLEAFLQRHGLKSTNWLGFNKSMRYEEELLAPNDALYALGPSRRDAGPPVQDSYRVVPGTELVLFHAQGHDGELILTNKNEAQLTKNLRTGFVVGVVMLAIGVLGLLATWAGAFR